MTEFNPAQLYQQQYEKAIQELASRGLDPEDPLVKKTARDIAKQAVQKAQQEGQC